MRFKFYLDFTCLYSGVSNSLFNSLLGKTVLRVARKRVLECCLYALQVMQSGGQGGGGSHQQILQTQDGQQIVVQQSGPNGSIQQVQVVPVQSAGGQQILIQQQPSGAGGGAASQQAQQVIQTPDGQTLIYQPIQVRSYAKYFCKTLAEILGRLSRPVHDSHCRKNKRFHFLD